MALGRRAVGCFRTVTGMKRLILSRRKLLFLGGLALVIMLWFIIPTSQPCPVHHVRLYNGLAYVQYGLVRRNPQTNLYFHAETHQFPDSHRVIRAGCLFMPFDIVRFVLYCPQCRQAEDQWKSQHGKTP